MDGALVTVGKSVRPADLLHSPRLHFQPPPTVSVERKDSLPSCALGLGCWGCALRLKVVWINLGNVNELGRCMRVGGSL